MDTHHIWFDVNELPSGKIPYPEGSRIRVRSFTYGEIRVFSQSELDFRGMAEFVLEGVETTFDKWDLTLVDYSFLTLTRKGLAFPDRDYYSDSVCPKCGKLVRFIYNRAQVQYEDLNKSIKLPLETEITYKGEKKTLAFWPLTVGRFADLMGINKDPDEVSLMAKQVINTDFNVAKDIIYNASGDDILVLEEIDRMIYHEMKPLERVCGVDGCEGIAKLDLWREDSFLYPFRKPEESVRSRIRSGS